MNRALVAVSILSCVLVAQQPNSAAATAVFDNHNHPAAGTGPIITNTVGTTVSFSVTGAPSAGFLLAATSGAASPVGIPVFGGQVDLNLANPLHIWADGLSFSTGGLMDLLANTGTGTASFTFPICNAYMQSTNTFQVAVASPASPFGLTLSAATTFTGLCGVNTILGQGDDTTVSVTHGPYVSSTTFYDTTYTSMFVNSNGNITFGAGDATTYLETQAAMNTGAPRIAPNWDDYNFLISSGGSCVYTEGPTGWIVRYNSVGEYTLGGSNTFSAQYDVATGAITLNYPAGLQTQIGGDGLVGITKGGSAAPPHVVPSLRPVAFGGSFAGYSAIGLEGVNAVYLAGWDLSGSTVTFVPAVFGPGLANSYVVF